MPRRSATLGSIALLAFAGASGWVSLGTLMLLDARTMARAVALPPLWLLAALVAVGAAAAAVVRQPASRLSPLALTGLLWLPYVPGRVPAPCLIWQGPIEGLVWAAALAGVLAPVAWRWLVRAAGWVGEPRRAPYLAAIVSAVCAGAAFAAVEGLVPGGDEPHYLIITQSLLLDGDLRIENNHQRRDHWAYYPSELKPDYLQRGQDGAIYPIHPPGISVLVLPAFAVWGYRGAVATVIAVTALAGALAWRTAWLLAGTAGAAWFAWAAVWLTVPYFFHEFTIYPDGVGGLLVAVGLWSLIRTIANRPPGRLGWAATGAALACLPWLHTRFALLAASLAAVLGWRVFGQPAPDVSGRAGRWWDLAALLGAPVASAGLWLTYFWVIWGSASPTAPYGTYTNTSLAYAARGIPGLLFDQQFGLVASAPVYAVAALGFLRLSFARPRLAAELAAVALPYATAVASYGMWWGGVSAPARFVVALLPGAALPLAWWWREHPAPGWRAFALGLLLASVAAVVPKVSVDGGALIYNARDGVDLLLDWLAKSVDLSMALPSLHRDAPPAAWRDAAVWAAAGGLVAVLAWALARRPPRGAEPTWTLTTAGWAAAAMAAASIVWARHAVDGLTPSRSQAAALGAWQPDWQTTTWHLQPWRPLTRESFAREIELGSTARAARRPGDPAVFRASWLPAADYDVVTVGSTRLSGQLRVLIGRTDQVSERWVLEGRQAGYTGHVLRLPVPVHSVAVLGDAAASTAIADLRLRVRALRRAPATHARYARRAARFGASRLFAMDDHLYLEPGGIWTRAEAVTEIVIDTDDPARPPVLWLQTGPVATTTLVSDGAWSARLAMAPLERRPVALPPRAGGDAWVLTIASGAGFRPSEHDPTSADTRHLGVWVELQ